LVVDKMCPEYIKGLLTEDKEEKEQWMES